MTQEEKYSLHLFYGLIISTNLGNLRLDRLDMVRSLKLWALDNSRFIGGEYIADEVNSKNLENYTGRGFRLDQVNPYLRNLSDLTKPITQKDYNNGKPFVPADVILHAYGITQSIITTSCLSTNTIDKISLGVIQLLLKWHFAIGFEQGEYIEVTENNNPY